MRKLLHSVFACYQQTPPSMRASIVGMLVLLATVALFLTSCASTPEGLAREQAWYQVCTNVVGTLKVAAPTVPAPFNVPLEGFLAAATAALVAWNTRQGQRIKVLENGNGKPSGNPAAPPASPGPR